MRHTKKIRRSLLLLLPAIASSASTNTWQYDRVLYWSNFGALFVDAATQQQGPLDALLKTSDTPAPFSWNIDEDVTEFLLLLCGEVWGVTTSNDVAPSTSSQQPIATLPAVVVIPPNRTQTTTTTSSTHIQVRGGGRGGTKYSLFQNGDGSIQNDGIPTRYLLMHNGDKTKARSSLEDTLRWRQTEQIDHLLLLPHSQFQLAKKVFPHYFLGLDATNHIVLVQHPARLNLDLAKHNGLRDVDLLRHYVYVNEFLWQVLEGENAMATMLSIIDLQGLPVSVLRRRDVLKFIQQFVSTMDLHYPQRAHQTLVVNCPRWFNGLYKLLSPLLRETTKSKIAILGRGPAQDALLRQYLDSKTAAQLPAYFWSSYKKKRRGRKKPKEEEDNDNDDLVLPPPSPLEERLVKHVQSHLGNKKMQEVVEI